MTKYNKAWDQRRPPFLLYLYVCLPPTANGSDSNYAGYNFNTIRPGQTYLPDKDHSVFNFYFYVMYYIPSGCFVQSDTQSSSGKELITLISLSSCLGERSNKVIKDRAGTCIYDAPPFRCHSVIHRDKQWHNCLPSHHSWLSLAVSCSDQDVVALSLSARKMKRV